MQLAKPTSHMFDQQLLRMCIVYSSPSRSLPPTYSPLLPLISPIPILPSSLCLA